MPASKYCYFKYLKIMFRGFCGYVYFLWELKIVTKFKVQGRQQMILAVIFKVFKILIFCGLCRSQHVFSRDAHSLTLSLMI